MSVSVIVPVFQRPDVLSSFINSLAATVSPGTETIFVNDGSGAEAASVLESFAADSGSHGCSVTIISNDSPRGCGQALNQGLERAHGQTLIFADSDLLLEPGWQESLTSTISLPAPSTGTAAGMAASVLLYPQTGGVQHAGLRFSESLGRHWKLNARPQDLGDQVIEVQVAAFALFAMSRKVFESVGFLDETYLNGYEDFDYQLRARQQGFRTLIDPTQHSFHWERRNGPHRSANRKSNLARLWRQWGGALVDDLTQEIANGIVRVADSIRAAGVVDLAESRVDARRLRAAVSQLNAGLHWDDRSHSIGDGDDVVLPILPDSGPIDMGSPLVILVENFVHVTANHYWLQRRRDAGIADAFVDLYGNIVTAETLAEMSYPGGKSR